MQAHAPDGGMLIQPIYALQQRFAYGLKALLILNFYL